MDGEAVKEIAILEDMNKTIEVGGRTFGRSDFNPVIYDPRPGTLQGSTLVGLVDYLRHNREKIDHADLFLRVKNFAEVELVERFSGDTVSRTVFYMAKLDGNLPTFKFGEYLGVEEFIIKARALFQVTSDLDKIVSIVSRVVAQDEIVAEDDGLTQKLQVKKGVSGALTEGVTTQGVYSLKPYRTFRELDQVESKFILRIKGGEGLPRVALFDAEGETWRYTAALEVQAYLAEKLAGYGIDIPVIV